VSFALERARATITKLIPDRTTGEDTARVTTIALKIHLKTSADILAEFHPSLRHALFKPEGGVRFPSMESFGWSGTRRNVDIAIRPGPDLQPALTLREMTMRDLKIEPVDEGGTAVIALRFVAEGENQAVSCDRILEYVKEECWIDIQGGGELDLAPPSARTEIPGLDRTTPPQHPPAEPPETPSTSPAPEAIAAVRRLQPTPKGAKAKLAAYPDEVLQAAIAVENQAPDSRPLFIAMLEAEMKRRHDNQPKG